MHFSDPFACVDRLALNALAEPYGAMFFFMDVLGEPGPVPVKDGEAYRPGVKETIAWYPGRRETVKLLYHGRPYRSVTFLSALVGRGVWAALGPERTKAMSLAAGYTVGCFVRQYHPCDPLWGYPETRSPQEHPALARLKASPGVVDRLPIVACLMVALDGTKEYPNRACVVGLHHDDAYAVNCARRLLGVQVDFCPAEAFFNSCLKAIAE